MTMLYRPLVGADADAYCVAHDHTQYFACIDAQRFLILRRLTTNLRTYEPTNLRTYEPTNLRTYEPTNLRIYEPTNLRTYEPTNDY
ncbi:hypothetical protein EJA71_20145 [Pseudomonas sp. PB106]|nr:hypothetical protein EJA71_20145 [Pseudomonas sp. PB106]